MAKKQKSITLMPDDLLLSVAEEIKLPLLQIARAAEQSQLTGQDLNQQIKTSSESALKLIDSYVIGLKLAATERDWPLETVSLSSILYDSAHELYATAQNYGVALELHIEGRHNPVQTNQQALKAAMTSLGMALIEALPAQETTQLKLLMASHPSRYGQVAGIYADQEQVSKEALKQGRQLQGRSAQPLVQTSHTSGAGIFIADNILKSLKLNLISSRHHRLYGLGTILQPNRQLVLV